MDFIKSYFICIMKRKPNHNFKQNKRFTIIVFLVSLLVIALYIFLLNENILASNSKCHIIRHIKDSHPYTRCFPIHGGRNQLQNKIHKNKFQSVNTSETLLVYSAYYEQSRSWVRILALTSSLAVNVSCVVWHRNYHYITRGYTVNINENRDHRVTPGYVICPLCGARIPKAVSVIPGYLLDTLDGYTLHFNLTDRRSIVWDVNCSLENNTLSMQKLSQNLLTVNDVSQRSGIHSLRYLTACVSPIHGTNLNVHRLVEWIETNRLLGVDFFTVYVEDSTEDVLKALHYYQSIGVLEVLTWYIPVRDIHYHGQLAAINDCLYRNKPFTKYIMTIDLDEYIIPQKEDDYRIRHLISRIDQNAGNSHERNVYMFRHTRFYNNSDLNYSSGRHGDITLVTQSHVVQRKYIDELYRAKIIVKAADIVTLGIHTVWASCKDVDPYVVDPTVGLLHHYSGHYHPGTAIVTNTVMHKYTDRLYTNVTSVLKNVFSEE